MSPTNTAVQVDTRLMVLAGLNVRANMGLRPRYGRWKDRAGNERCQNGGSSSVVSVGMNGVVLRRSCRLNSRIWTAYCARTRSRNSSKNSKTAVACCGDQYIGKSIFLGLT